MQTIKKTNSSNHRRALQNSTTRPTRPRVTDTSKISKSAKVSQPRKTFAFHLLFCSIREKVRLAPRFGASREAQVFSQVFKILDRPAASPNSLNKLCFHGELELTPSQGTKIERFPFAMGDCPWLLTVILILGYTLSAALAWRSRLLLSERDGAYLILQSCAIISFSLLLWLSLVVNVLLIIPTPSLSHRLAQLLVQLSDLFLLLAFQAALLVEMRIRHAGYKINCWMDMAILLETLCSLLVLVLAASVIVEMVTEVLQDVM
eukprot:g16782.t1